MSFSFGGGFGTSGISTDVNRGIPDSIYWDLKLKSSPSVNLNAAINLSIGKRWSVFIASQVATSQIKGENEFYYQSCYPNPDSCYSRSQNYNFSIQSITLSTTLGVSCGIPVAKNSKIRLGIGYTFRSPWLITKSYYGNNISTQYGVDTTGNAYSNSTNLNLSPLRLYQQSNRVYNVHVAYEKPYQKGKLFLEAGSFVSKKVDPLDLYVAGFKTSFYLNIGMRFDLINFSKK